MFINFKNHINLYILLIFVILVSCKLQEPLKTHGIIYLENRSEKLTLNKTNKNDVVDIMGKPHIKENENDQTWIYIERVFTKGRYHQLGQHVLKDSNVLVLNFDKFDIFNIEEIFPKTEPLKAFLSSLIIKFAVPSAVFNATLPVKPSETITLTSPFISSFPSI